MLKKIIFYFLIFLLSILDFLCLHDILRGEKNPYLEYFILFFSLIIFLLIIFRLLRRLYISLLILVLIGITVFIGYNHLSRKRKEKASIKMQRILSLPKDKKTCEKQGGVWAKIGLAPVESCNLRTKDAGKTCFSQEDCEGSCLANLSEKERRKAARRIPVFKSGKCSPFLITVGCQARVQNGVVRGILCVD